MELIALTEHGNNADIKVHILDDNRMKLNGFTRTQTGAWYFCNRVYKDITFNFSIRSEDDWQIDVLDEWFLQPYDYQEMLRRKIPNKVPSIVKKNVDEIMNGFVHKGIISGWKVGDYI